MSNLSNVRKHSGLFLLLIIYVVLAGFFSTTIPLSKAPDEYVHFTYIRFLIDHGRPPVNLAEQQGAGYKSDQPPLYHSLVALLTAPIDASEPPSFKFSWEPASRQLIDIVLPRALLIYTEDEVWPFAGLFLAWFAGRWLSILLSSLTLIITYFTALEIFPEQRRLALAAAGTLAFVPRFIIIGSVLSDDNMVGVLMALFLYVVVRLFKYTTHVLPAFAIMGALVGLALSTKYSALPVPFEVLLLTLWLARRQHWGRRKAAAQLAVFAASLVVVAAPWFGFMWRHFNQIAEHGLLKGLLNPIMAGGNNAQETEAILNTVSGGGIASFFPEGNFGDWIRFLFTQFWDVPIFGVPQPYPLAPVLILAATLGLLAAAGWWKRWWRNQDQQRLWLGGFTLHLTTFVPIPLVRFIAIGDIHDPAQARHILFPAAPALAILLLAGVVALFALKRQKIAAGAVVGFAFLLTLGHIFYYVTGFPAPLPVRADPASPAAPENTVAVEFDDGLRLRGFNWRISRNPSLDVDLYWAVTASPTVDYRTELTLLNSAGKPQRRWLSHPANGRFPTRAWDAGDSVRDAINIPLAGLPADSYQVELRLLDWDGNPLPATSGNAAPLFEFSLSEVSLQPPSLWQQGRPVANPAYRYRETIPLTGVVGQNASLVGPDGKTYPPVVNKNGLYLFMVGHTWPSGAYTVQVDGVDFGLRLSVENLNWDFTPPEMAGTVNANFNDELVLLGYDLPLRRIKAGDGIPLVLYWQSLRRMSNSYIIFDRLLAAGGQAWGGYDRLPKETYPTSLWLPGQVVADGFAVPVDPATPDGIYNIVVGLYDEADPAARSLPLFQAGQPLAATSITLGPVKVGGPPPEAVLSEQAVAPHTSLSVELGDPPVILLRGYDLAQTDELLQLKLYWQSLAQTPVNWTTFVHLRNESGETVAQQDGPAGGGVYPTSLWDAGEIISDSFAPALPAEIVPGSYQLVVGLYNPYTFERLFVAGSADNSVLLAEIE